jgi:hypothetical protein
VWIANHLALMQKNLPLIQFVTNLSQIGNNRFTVVAVPLPSKVGTQVRYAWSLWWNKPRRPLASKFDLVVNLTTAKARGRTVP